MHAALDERLEAGEQAFIDQVVAGRAGRPGALLGILEAVQNHHPTITCRWKRCAMSRPRRTCRLSQIYSVATFYALFNLEPQGDNVVCICRGTACHTRGSRDLLGTVPGPGLERTSEDSSDADKVSLTTPDRKFTVRTVACFGQCALAPVVEVNHHI